MSAWGAALHEGWCEHLLQPGEPPGRRQPLRFLREYVPFRFPVYGRSMQLHVSRKRRVRRCLHLASDGYHQLRSVRSPMWRRPEVPGRYVCLKSSSPKRKLPSAGTGGRLATVDPTHASTGAIWTSRVPIERVAKHLPPEIRRGMDGRLHNRYIITRPETQSPVLLGRESDQTS